jgi:hypothetical protein
LLRLWLLLFLRGHDARHGHGQRGNQEARSRLF